jgi:hypothetical protein
MFVGNLKVIAPVLPTLTFFMPLAAAAPVKATSTKMIAIDIDNERMAILTFTLSPRNGQQDASTARSVCG